MSDHMVYGRLKGGKKRVIKATDCDDFEDARSFVGKAGLHPVLTSVPRAPVPEVEPEWVYAA